MLRKRQSFRLPRCVASTVIGALLDSAGLCADKGYFIPAAHRVRIVADIYDQLAPGDGHNARITAEGYYLKHYTTIGDEESARDCEARILRLWEKT